MKGIVFSEFIEMVEDTFSPEIADQIIMETNPESEGAYTSVGTYDHNELVAMVVKLSEISSTPVPDLVQAFGNYLLTRFVKLYPAFFAEMETTFDFLSTIENHVHVEVKKLYSDAELPTFDIEKIDDNTLIMEYKSVRPFADLAEGLIRGAADYFNENIDISREDLSGGIGNHARFTLKKA